MKFFNVFFILIFNLNKLVLNQNVKSDHVNAKIVFMTPKHENAQIQINNRAETLLSSSFHKGWYIEANTKQKFYIFLLANSTESSHKYESSSNLTSFVIHRKRDHKSKPKNTTTTEPSVLSKIYYIFFTLNSTSCSDYLFYTHIPIIVNEPQIKQKRNSLFKIEIDISLNHASDGSYYICLCNQDDYSMHADQNEALFEHQGTSSVLAITTYQNSIPLWVKLIVYVIFVCLNSIFNGLNLGLMALSVEELELLVKTSDDENERKYAKNILPLRRKGNYLLCSILLSITLSGSISTLILDDLVAGLFAGIISTITLTFIGEILPQSICSKYSLPIGSYTRNFTYIFIYLTTLASYPLSKIIDYILGDELPTKYSRDKIKELIKKAQGLPEKQCKIINGALDLKNKKVSDVMIDIDDVYMLQEDQSLNFETIVSIYNSGFSRIPVYQKNRNDISGYFHIKDLTLVDPDDGIQIKTLLSVYKHHVAFCYNTDSLFEMFNKFRKGSTHLAFVLELVQNNETDPYEKCVGIITLHDVIEFITSTDINDELNCYSSKSLDKAPYYVSYLRKIIDHQRRKSITYFKTNLNNNNNNNNEKVAFSMSDELDGSIEPNSMINLMPIISLQTKLCLLQILTSMQFYFIEILLESKLISF